MVDRASAVLGLRTSTLIFTVIHSVNLMLITTPPEDLVWALSWCLAPLKWLGCPVERLGFQLLLALRFLPLVQEELQNLLRSLASRAVNLRQLGFKAGFGLVLAVGERLLANILLRAEQGADALGRPWWSNSRSFVLPYASRSSCFPAEWPGDDRSGVGDRASGSVRCFMTID